MSAPRCPAQGQGLCRVVPIANSGPWVAMGHSMSQRSILFVRLMGNLHVLKVVKQYYSCTIRSSLDCWICSQMLTIQAVSEK